MEKVDLCYNFFEKFNYLGEITWSISLNKITIEFCYKKNLIVELMCFDLNEIVKESPELLNSGWTRNFQMLHKESKFRWSKPVCSVLSK